MSASNVTRIYLLRHAEAAEKALGDTDFNRPLTARGREDAARMGQAMAERSWRPEVVLSSPALRCKETWDAVADAVPVDAIFHERILYDGSAADYVDAIAGAGGHGSVLVCGHNPMTAEAADLLLDRRNDRDAFSRQGFKKGALAVIEIDGPLSKAGRTPGRLVAYLTRKDI